jgi:hypothetical protein
MVQKARSVRAEEEGRALYDAVIVGAGSREDAGRAAGGTVSGEAV